MASCLDMDDSLSDYECKTLSASETGWVRELATDAGIEDGEMFAIAVHLPGTAVMRGTVPVFDLFLGVLPDQDTVVRRTADPGEEM